MTRDHQAIQVIEKAYKPNEERQISREEVESYVQSIDFLENILLFSKTAFLVVEFKTWSYLHCSSNTLEVLGRTPEELMKNGPVFGLNLLHPDDLALQGEIHPAMVNFFSSLPSAEKDRYKFSFTSRLIHPDGREIQLLQHNFFVKWDEAGNPLIKLITFTDITAYKKTTDVVFYITHLPVDGESRLIHQQNFSDGDDIALSPRELEILELVSGGMSSRQIGDRLELAESTVKNHKKAIMKKLGCSNSAEMISLATLYGLLSMADPKALHYD